MTSISLNTALSGYSAAVTRLSVSANNIANSNSTQTVDENGDVVNTPYVPQQVTQSTQTTGGVSTQVVPVNPPSIGLPDANNPAADSNGITQYPNSDTANNLVQAQVATYTAQGNLSAIKAQQNTFNSLLNIVA